MYLERAVFKGEIVTEFIVPEGGTEKVIILATGAPGYPRQTDTAMFLMKQGFAVFIPRYRGSWESKGEFLKEPLQKDILDVLHELPNGFSDVLGKNRYKIDPKKVTIIGSSFGGPAALFAATDPVVTKVIVICPVVDWQSPSIDEPFDVLRLYMEKGFGEGYRISRETWEKLEVGEIYNPVSHVTELKEYADKIWIIHTLDDRSVSPVSIQKFAKDIGCKITTLKKGGHVGTSILQKWPLSWKVKKYLQQ